MAELVDATDLKSVGGQPPCRFDPGRPHRRPRGESRETLATTAAVAFGAIILALGGAAQAQTTLSLAMAGDDSFQVWLSTSPTAPGTLIGSGVNWAITHHFTSGPLKPGQTYCLHIKTRNTGGPGGLIGEFRLSGPAFRFAGGGQDLVTGPAGWTGNVASASAAPWVAPTGPVVSEGVNGAAPWGRVFGVAPTAQWIWLRNPVCVCWVNFSATIMPTTGLGAKPVKR